MSITKPLKIYRVLSNEWYAATTPTEALMIAALTHRKPIEQMGSVKSVKLESNLDMVVIDDDTGHKTSLRRLLDRVTQPSFLCCTIT